MDGHMLGISLVEISTTKLWRLSRSEITANQQSYIKTMHRQCKFCVALGVDTNNKCKPAQVDKNLNAVTNPPIEIKRVSDSLYIFLL